MTGAWAHPGLERIDAELHDLSQPMTALQVRLEIGLAVDDAAGLREAVEGALDQTRRVFAAMERAKAALLQAEQELSTATLFETKQSGG